MTNAFKSSVFKSLKVFVAGFLSCAILFGGAIAYATDGQLKATLLSTFNMKLYGKDYLVKDASGAYLKPILYNKTPYIPVPVIVNGLQVPVEYDTAQKTIWIGGKILNVPVDNTSVYTDYYGSIITKDAAKLSTPNKKYKWGIANGSTLDMSTFGCYLKPNSKYTKFKASLFIDEEVKMPLLVEFRKDKYDGEVLSSITLEPGQTQEVKFDIGGVNTFYIMSSIRIGHDVVKKIVIGEPTFYTEAPKPIQSNSPTIK